MNDTLHCAILLCLLIFPKWVDIKTLIMFLQNTVHLRILTSISITTIPTNKAI